MVGFVAIVPPLLIALLRVELSTAFLVENQVYFSCSTLEVWLDVSSHEHLCILCPLSGVVRNKKLVSITTASGVVRGTVPKSGYLFLSFSVHFALVPLCDKPSLSAGARGYMEYCSIPVL
jgi:hypothetical protein